MRSRCLFLFFFFFVSVRCDDGILGREDKRVIREGGILNDGGRFSNSGASGSSSNSRSVGEHFSERSTSDAYNSGNNYSGPQGSSSYSNTNNRPTGTQSFGSRPSGLNEELTFGEANGSRPNNQGSTFGQTSGFEPGNEGHSGRPNMGSTFSQTDGSRPNNQGSIFGQTSGSRPSNEGHSGRPNTGSTFGHTSGNRPNHEGSTFGQATGFRPNEESFGKPIGFIQEGETGSGGSNKKPLDSQSGSRPEGGESQGAGDGKEDEKDVCFTHLGCFKMGKPWKSTLRPVGAPHAPEKIQTLVHFYSRQNPKQPENITVYPKVNMGRAPFDARKISAMIVHGFSNSGNATWMKEMKDVYLRKVDANVMIVDWGKGAQLLSYLQVAGNTRVVGKQLGMFVRHLIEEYGADPGRFHLIGHSLGAQICSYLAKDVPGIARLTALDPAQPGFEGFSKEVRLDQTDAEFVDVIHTDARPFIPTLGFGMMAPHGHVDFYMNGGFDQPGCVPPPKKDLPVIKSFLDLAKFPVETIAKTIACPHSRAYEYLIEAFNETDNCIFWGHKTDVKNVFKTVTNTVTQGLFKKFTALSTTCSKDDCIPLGFATKKSPLRGSFVVTTSGRSPYCISEPGVPPETLPKERKGKSVIEKIKETPFLG